MAASTPLIVPAARPVYDGLGPLMDAFIRIAMGLIIIPHGYEKLFLGAAQPTSRNWVLKVFGDPLIGAYFVGSLEFFGGILLVLGLFTRIAAAGIAIQMAVISFLILWPNWFWNQRGMEYALLMMAVCLFIFVRGGGRYSLDAKLGREF